MLIHMVDFLPYFYKGDNFHDFLFAFLHIKSLLKGIYFKRKEFAPRGSKFFPFRVEPFSEVRQKTKELSLIKVYQTFKYLTEY